MSKQHFIGFSCYSFSSFPCKGSFQKISRRKELDSVVITTKEIKETHSSGTKTTVPGKIVHLIS